MQVEVARRAPATLLRPRSEFVPVGSLRQRRTVVGAHWPDRVRPFQTRLNSGFVRQRMAARDRHAEHRRWRTRAAGQVPLGVKCRDAGMRDFETP